jgi:LPS sulfotransferase NodH
MSPYDSYIICTAPRSGSTLLCTLLKATGIAGNPESYFYASSLAEWCADLGITVAANEPQPAVIEAVLQAVLLEGRGGTAMLGIRQQAGGLAFLCQKLAVRYPHETTDLARFNQAFGTTLFIHLTRPNKIAQAVSLLKAEQSGLWHMAADGTDLERTAPHCEPAYDSARLSDMIRTLTAHDQDWTNWFKREGIIPVCITYDDLEADPLAVLRKVLHALALSHAAANHVTPGVRKLSDRVSRAWEARFRAENGLP